MSKVQDMQLLSVKKISTAFVLSDWALTFFQFLRIALAIFQWTAYEEFNSLRIIE